MSSLNTLISQLVEEAIRFAAALDLPLIVERSVSSEAVYLKTRRAGYWFGVRIAAHAPAHLSSGDCSQILVNEYSELTDELLETLRTSITSGGRVVADPAEVYAAIQHAHLRKSGTARFRPLPSASQISALRHRLNVRAAWCYELEQSESRLNPS